MTQQHLFPDPVHDAPSPTEGGSVALIVLLFVFVLGLLIGAWLW